MIKLFIFFFNKLISDTCLTETHSNDVLLCAALCCICTIRITSQSTNSDGTQTGRQIKIMRNINYCSYLHHYHYMYLSYSTTCNISYTERFMIRNLFWDFHGIYIQKINMLKISNRRHLSVYDILLLSDQVMHIVLHAFDDQGSHF